MQDQLHFDGTIISSIVRYPLYKRGKHDNTIIKNQIELDYRFDVPYNPKLLLIKYHAHINMK